MDIHGQQNYSKQTIQFKKYSRLTAQIIRGGVKKKLYDIKKRGRIAVDELLDALEVKLKKSALRKGASSLTVSTSSAKPSNKLEDGQKHENGTVYDEIAETLAEGIDLIDKLKHGKNAELNADCFEKMILGIMNANRDTWTRFILNAVSERDAESISCFGTNAIYGGYLTQTEGNGPRCSYYDVGNGLSQTSLVKIKELIRRDTLAGRRVCLIRGSGLLSNEMLKIYRFFSETAFILVDESGTISKVSLPSLGIYNVMYICPSSARLSLKDVPLYGIISLADSGASEDGFAEDHASYDASFRRTYSAGQGSNCKLTFGGVLSVKNK